MDILDPKNYINRELSWLKFNYRILEEARNKQNPLFERLKFLAISASNLDEFFMVRVAKVEDEVYEGVTKKDLAGFSPKEELKAVLEDAHQFMTMQYSTYQRSLVPALKLSNIHVLETSELTPNQLEFVEDYYHHNVEPVLTPMAVDASRPFPLILNKTVNIAVMLQMEDEVGYGTVQVPSVLDRYIELPGSDGRYFVFLEDVIKCI